MKKIKDQNSCVRVARDELQINRCKENLFEVKSSSAEIAQILALAGNEVRLKILLLLQQEQRLCVCDLGEILEMKVPAVSQHLRKMKDGRLLLTEREGTVIFYRINPRLEPTLNTILNLIPKSVLV
jgi:ArsR family transcriptional regulator, lead/cadmium/zinc/bismuth-responsive transcriptional repressor